MRTWLLLLVVVLTTVGCTRKTADVPAGAPDEPGAATATTPAVDREPVDVEDVRPPEAVNSGNEPTTPTGDVGQRAPKVRPLPALSSEAARTARKAPARVSIAVVGDSARMEGGDARRLHHGTAARCLLYRLLLVPAALTFVAGVMNLLWVAAITALVLIEKITPAGYLIGRAAGIPFIAVGVYIIIHG